MLHILISVRNELAVDVFIVPGFWHLVHDADGIRNLRLDSACCISEELHVARLIVASVPPMLTALTADLEHESDLLLLLHQNFFNCNVPNKIFHTQ